MLGSQPYFSSSLFHHPIPEHPQLTFPLFPLRRMPRPYFPEALLLLRSKRCLEFGSDSGQPDLWTEPMEASLGRGLYLSRLHPESRFPEEHPPYYGRAQPDPRPHLRSKPGDEDQGTDPQGDDPGLLNVHRGTPTGCMPASYSANHSRTRHVRGTASSDHQHPPIR